MDRFDDAACRVLGVGRTDLRALNLLEHGPLSAGEITTRLGLTTGSVTLLVDRLVSAGYVSRHHPPDDRRRTVVQLEPATYRAFAEVYRPLGIRVAAAEAALDPTQRAASSVVLTVLTKAFTVRGRELNTGQD